MEERPSQVAAEVTKWSVRSARESAFSRRRCKGGDCFAPEARMKVAGGKLGETKRTHRIGGRCVRAPAGRMSNVRPPISCGPPGRGIFSSELPVGAALPVVEPSHRLPSSAPLGPEQETWSTAAPAVVRCGLATNPNAPPRNKRLSSRCARCDPLASGAGALPNPTTSPVQNTTWARVRMTFSFWWGTGPLAPPVKSVWR